MSEPYVREYDERCEYIADTIGEHQVLFLPLSGYGELSGEAVMGYEIDAEFTEDCRMGGTVAVREGRKTVQKNNNFGKNEDYYLMTLAGTTVLSVSQNQLSGTRHIFKFDRTNLSAGIDDVTVSLSSSYSYFPRPLWYYLDGNGYYTNHDTRIYSIKLYGADGQLFYNYLPVRIGNSGNFYDTVNKQMLYSIDYT